MAAMPNLHWFDALQHVYIAMQMFPPRYFAKFSPPGSPWRAFFCLCASAAAGRGDDALGDEGSHGQAEAGGSWETGLRAVLEGGQSATMRALHR
ncbi:hypothetical protein GCM10011335_10950 [Aureimonas glaciei]|uniref:Uncharacterized protein n=1 Tax=Aureimonas glaciei TaxID=1776957 RepID=A0A917D8S0_9HYPH|nr:hypothetical protein GCM10011335_10950 [Aureimonas glaciei]